MHPEAHALGHLLPVADVGHDRFAAQSRELGDAHLLLDLVLVVALDPALSLQELFHLVLHGQPVRIPARLARRVVAAHGLVARKHVLERARQHVVDSGLAVGGRRTLVETEARASLGHGNGLLERTVLAPKRQHLLLERGPVISTRNFLETQFQPPHTTSPRAQRTRPGDHEIIAVPPGFVARATSGTSWSVSVSWTRRLRLLRRPRAARSDSDSGVIFGGFRPGAHTVPRSLWPEWPACLSPSTSCRAN